MDETPVTGTETPALPDKPQRPRRRRRRGGRGRRRRGGSIPPPLAPEASGQPAGLAEQTAAEQTPPLAEAPVAETALDKSAEMPAETISAEPESASFAPEPSEPEKPAQLPEPPKPQQLDVPSWFEAAKPAGEIKTLKFPGLDSGQARQTLLQFIQEQVERAGVRNVILGLSGGLDSAVAANLLVESLGRERVHMIFCTEGERSNQDRGRAGLVARFLKCPLDIYDLRPVLQAGVPGWVQLPPPERQARAARLRAAYFYHQAGRLGGLVAGSVNKTKCWVGQLGRHAELSCDFNLLGDLYQSQVLELARALNVPRVVLDYAAHPGGGRPPIKAWKEIDYYLYQVIDARLSLAHLQRLGVHADKLRWVYHRIRESAGLRRTAPVADVQRAYVPRGGSF